MYLRTTEGLGQAPLLYRSFAGRLGEPPLPFEIQKFLDRVKKSPQDYEAVLLVSAFHVEPFLSVQLRRVLGESYLNDAKDPFEEAKAIQGRVIQSLEEICKEHLNDSGFRKLFDKEKQLIPVVAKAFKQTIKRIETQGWVEQVLIQALLAPDPPALTEQVGKPFVVSNLPAEITEKIVNSRVPETHYARLGKAFLLMAEQRQKDNRAFKKRVEKERKKQPKP